MRGNRDIFSGQTIYNRETISRQEDRISKTLVILNKGKTTIWEEIENIFSGKSIYNRETISRQEHRISERL